MDKFLIKLPRLIWLCLAICAACGIIFAGAWWHILTLCVAVAMYFAFCESEEEEDGQR